MIAEDFESTSSILFYSDDMLQGKYTDSICNGPQLVSRLLLLETVVLEKRV
jgi:hypothetical protein